MDFHLNQLSESSFRFVLKEEVNLKEEHNAGLGQVFFSFLISALAKSETSQS